MPHGTSQHAGHWHDGAVMHSPRFYQAMTGLLFLGRRAGVYRSLAGRSGAGAGQDVLDLGCGTGVLSRAMADRVGPAGSVLGIDPAVEMVDHAARTSPATCRYRVMSAERLDLPDASFDTVVSALAVHHIPPEQRARAAAEAFRVLRPGGVIMLADLRLPDLRWANGLVQRLTRHATDQDPTEQLPELLDGAGFLGLTTGRVPPVFVTATARRPGSNAADDRPSAPAVPVSDPR